MIPSADPATARTDRRIAVLVGIFAFGFFWWVWGAWRPLPAGSDESAYLLQAKIFASGQLVAAPRPFPEFFWQYHVFVDPVLAAKYPPGHSALLALGELVRAPWVIPLFAAAISSALLFLLTARWSTRGVGLLAVSLMITSETSLRFWPSYFSETTTAALFLIGWLALANYWDRGRVGWLLALAICVGFGALTRPLTMLAFAVPAAVLTVIAIRRHRGWRQLPWAAAATLTVVGLSFLWNQKVTGDWRRSPHAEYARRFIPSDKIGFGSTATPPADSLPPELRAFNGAVQRIHAYHTPASVPRMAVARASSIARETWLYLGFPGLFALLAFISAPVGAWLIAAATIVSVFTAHLFYAHVPSWTVYYLEIQAPLAALTAIGIQVFTQWLQPIMRRFVRTGARVESLQPAALATIALILLLPRAGILRAYRGAHQEWVADADALVRAVKGIYPPRALVFVIEDITSHPERSMVQNVVDLNHDPLVLAHHRGERDSLLIESLRDRAAYVLREEYANGKVRFRLDPIGQPKQP